jgi:ABC-type Co2+ transport system permease subunit
MPLADYLWAMLIGFGLTITVETAVLLLGLSRRHSRGVRLFAGVWLTACTYPIVWLVLPPLFEHRGLYLLVAETFAPVAEGALFWWVFVKPLPPNRPATYRDLGAITAANLCSFGLGEVLHALTG